MFGPSSDVEVWSCSSYSSCSSTGLTSPIANCLFTSWGGFCLSRISKSTYSTWELFDSSNVTSTMSSILSKVRLKTR
jgi:hypothetical protein